LSDLFYHKRYMLKFIILKIAKYNKKIFECQGYINNKLHCRYKFYIRECKVYKLLELIT
jgi:hypothetical protein